MASSSTYNVVDRALHYLAFSAPFVQKALCDLENDVFKRELEDVVSHDEVFITGLPRAGTTLLLELLYGTGEFATFTYRQMPFILAPMIWSRLSRAHRKRGVEVERAHHDGMVISFESPEAFEEVVWLAHLRRAFVGDDKLLPITPSMLDEEFESAMRNSVRKVLALSRRDTRADPQARYLSKNNANLSRLDVLEKLFPTATILVAFREPAAHVGSLMSQHDRFRREHARDPFSKRYMAWLGHYEFGENFRPIDFAGWLDGRPVPSKPDETFWMRYWAAAYGHVLENRSPNVRFVDFDRLRMERGPYLQRLAETVGLSDPSMLVAAGRRLRSPTTRPIGAERCDGTAWSLATDVYSRLRALAI